jgi:hypothetical protein
MSAKSTTTMEARTSQTMMPLEHVSRPEQHQAAADDQQRPASATPTMISSGEMYPQAATPAEVRW